MKTINVKMANTVVVHVSTVVGNKVTKAVSEKQNKNNKVERAPLTALDTRSRELSRNFVS